MLTTSLLIHLSMKENRYKGSYGFFSMILNTTTLMVGLEFLKKFTDGTSGQLGRIANIAVNSLLTCTILLPLTSWLLYMDYRVYKDVRKLKPHIAVYVIINLAVVGLFSYNFINPILYFFDEYNVFHRTWMIPILGGLQILILLGYFLIALINKTIYRDDILKLFGTLTFFPILGGLVQNMFYGSVFVSPMFSFIPWVAYLMIEREELTKDYLTELRGRVQLEHKLRVRLTRHKPFSLIMFDLDNFKTLNDTYGHAAGDEALKAFANMLKESRRSSDYAYRYAGDEFMLLLNSDDQALPKTIVTRIEKRMEEYNRRSGLSVNLAASNGTVFVDGHTHWETPDLLAEVDRKMYQCKNKHRRTDKLVRNTTENSES